MADISSSSGCSTSCCSLPCRQFDAHSQCIHRELSSATFETNNIIHTLTPSPFHHWQSVYDSLLPRIDGLRSSLQNHELASFGDLLNAVLSQANLFSSTAASEPLVFSVYGRHIQQADFESAAQPSNPDLVGLSRRLATEECVAWHEVDIPVQVKDDWELMTVKAATHARCILHTTKARRFVLAILYEYTQRVVRFAFYHRAGVTTTEALRLDENEGFRYFVRVLVGISRWQSPESRGLDSTRDNTTFWLAGLGTYNIVQTLCDRASVRGRATRVYLVSRIVDQISTLEPAVSTDKSPSQTLRDELSKRRPATERSAWLSVLGWSSVGAAFEWLRTVFWSTPASLGPFNISPDIQNGPASDRFILKESFPLADRATEGKMFASVVGQFGVPDVRGWYRVSDTTSLLPPDARFWSYRREAESGSPERRVQLRVLFEQRGRYITEAQGPYELLECVLHAMIGHWNLFKNGWLQRDVSLGNILLLDEKIERKPMKDFASIGTCTSCIGILIDGDQATRWKDAERTTGQKRSATLPFLSMRSVVALFFGHDCIVTAVDDLESFLWVLIYAALLTAKARGPLQPLENMWLSELTTHSGQACKPCIPRECVKYATSPILVALAPLFAEWYSVATAASHALSNPPVHTLAFYRKYYEQYLKIGFKHLQSLPKTWEELNLPQINAKPKEI